MLEIIINDLAQLPSAARELLDVIRNKGVVALYGSMGAGKTSLIKAICTEAGVIEMVSSPTFSLVNRYETSEGETIYHFDFYRINCISEAYDLGYEEYFYSGDLCFVEWPELVEELLPPETIRIHLEVRSDGSRLARLSYPAM
ncbi:MAG: tRNA (adenosine(37)-N6)-threonylcarbamoyltransferase complex ATPase subunit type 1 TsaE [Prevotellaceae bacterium]|jgi:tRNA threonylcarbamoyladenosine biosynthesis protein TsaE|nr:tRNA (adenosine(37)-N6)-threonylcarbamoyltransferase complex ATPase subunit type 1 TsaE [Prevotellaceae bacterium]